MENVELVCRSGKASASVGGSFNDKDGAWEIVGFGGEHPETGRSVYVRHKSGRLPSHYQQWGKDQSGDKSADTMEMCGDSVAACLLEMQDGKPRSSRGDLLKFKPAPIA